MHKLRSHESPTKDFHDYTSLVNKPSAPSTSSDPLPSPLVVPSSFHQTRYLLKNTKLEHLQGGLVLQPKVNEFAGCRNCRDSSPMIAL